MEIDLRRNPYHLSKKYWRAEREKRARRSHIYRKPVLTAIKLDPRQAMLAQCVIGGVFMNDLRTFCVGPNAGGLSISCPAGGAVRGASDPAARNTGDGASIPS